MNGCGTSVARTLAISKLNPATPGVIDVIQTGFCPNRTYSYTLATMPANATSVQWTIPSGATLISGQGTVSITISYSDAAMTGIVTATTINNCGTSTIRSTAVKLPACPPPGFSRNNSANDNDVKMATVSLPAEIDKITVMPNPSTSSFKLTVNSISKQPVSVRLTDASGKLLQLMNIQANRTINFGNNLKAGIYFLIIEENQVRKIERIIKL